MALDLHHSFPRPTYSILGHVPGTDLYLDTDTYQSVRVHHYLFKSSISSNKNLKKVQPTAEHSIFRSMFHNLFLQAKEIPGIQIFRSSATIYYTNAEMYLEALQEKVCGSIHPSQLSSELLFWALYGLAFSSPFLMTPDVFAQSGIDIGKLLREKKKKESKQKRKQEKEKKRARKEEKKAKKEGDKGVWHTKKHLVSTFSKNRFKLVIFFFFFFFFYRE